MKREVLLVRSARGGGAAALIRAPTRQDPASLNGCNFGLWLTA